MLDHKKAVIFDLDGTLVDSMGVWGQIDIDYLGRRGRTIPKDLQKAVEGLAFTEVAEYFKKRFSLPDTIDEIKAEWNAMAMDQYCHHVLLKDGVREFLVYLKEQGFVMGVASSNSAELVRAALSAHGILKYFSSILTCCEVERGKPAPDVYLEVARRLKTAPSECIVFEDIPFGIMAGKAAGMTACAVYDTYSIPYEAEKRRLADYYIHSYREILDGTYEEL